MSRGSAAPAFAPALLVSLALALPAAADEDRFVDWSTTVGEWYSGEVNGLVRLDAARLGMETPREDLRLQWFEFDPDAGAYRAIADVGPLDLCGATTFGAVALRLVADQTPRLADVVVEVTSLAETPEAQRVRVVFVEVDKIGRSYRTLNCRE